MTIHRFFLLIASLLFFLVVLAHPSRADAPDLPPADPSDVPSDLPSDSLPPAPVPSALVPAQAPVPSAPTSVGKIGSIAWMEEIVAATLGISLFILGAWWVVPTQRFGRPEVEPCFVEPPPLRPTIGSSLGR